MNEGAFVEAARRETVREIIDAMSALPANSRLALLMALQGHTCHEIAELADGRTRQPGRPSA